MYELMGSLTSGTATANVIRTLHAAPEPLPQEQPGRLPTTQLRHRRPNLGRLAEEDGSAPHDAIPSEADEVHLYETFENIGAVFRYDFEKYNCVGKAMCSLRMYLGRKFEL